MIEELFAHRIGENYRQARDQKAREICHQTQVNLFDLSTAQGRLAFLEALHASLQERGPWISERSPEALLHFALDQGMLVDRFDLYLEDYFKLKREKSWWKDPRHWRILERARSLYDRWDNSVIAEYTWEQQKRFVRIPQEDIFYEVAYSRNRHIFSPRLQQRLHEETFAIVGLGVGSAIAYLLALCGAKHFIVVDGGDVTLHDHNRLLGADVRESGINHAVHWTRMALKTNPYAQIRCYPANLSARSTTEAQEKGPGLREFLTGASIVIEEADALLVKAAVRKAAKEARIPVFMGADLGREGQVQYDSPSPDDPILEGRLTEDVWQELQALSPLDFERVTALAADVFVGREDISAEYQQALLEAHQAGTPFWPQVGSSAFASARGTVEAVLRYLEGETPAPRQRIL